MASSRGGSQTMNNDEWERFFSKHVKELQKLHGERIASSEKAHRMVRLIKEHLERLQKCQCPRDRIGLQYYHTMLYNLFTTLDMYTKEDVNWRKDRLELFQRYMELQMGVKATMDVALPPASRVCTAIQQRSAELIQLYQPEFSHNKGYSEEYDPIRPPEVGMAPNQKKGGSALNVMTQQDMPYPHWNASSSSPTPPTSSKRF